MTHNPNHPAGGAGAVKAPDGWALVPIEPTQQMLEAVASFPHHLSAEHPDPADPWHACMKGAALADQLAAASQYRRMLALSPTPVPEPTAADMRAFGASAVAAYKWPGDTPEHRAARAAYCEGAASVVPEPEAEGEERGWLIELKGNVPSWAIVNPHDYDEHWTTDSTKALRFARKTDAQAYIDHIGWSEAFPSEHIWDDGKARPPSEAEGEAVAWKAGDTVTLPVSVGFASPSASSAIATRPSSEAEIADLRAKLDAALAAFADGAYADACKGSGDIYQHALALTVEKFRKAEAERDRMKQALIKICQGNHSGPHRDIARAALAGEEKTGASDV